MAYTNNANKANNADGFLNITLCDAKGKPILKNNGKPLTLQKGVALFRTDRVGRSLLEAKEADPDFTVKIQGNVHVVDNSDDEEENYSFA